MTTPTAFIKPEANRELDPVTYFNRHRTWADAVEGAKHILWRDSSSDILFETSTGPVAIIPADGTVTPPAGNMIGLQTQPYTKFQLFSRLRFDYDYISAIFHIETTWLNHDIPYVRIGTDYFKVFNKTDRYGVTRKTLKPWKKEEIKADHGPGIFKRIHKYSDFIISPNNLVYHQNVEGCYNLYAPFQHNPIGREVTEQDIPVTMQFMKHIFGDQLNHGLTYMKVLYQHPDLPLPVLCLVSSERQTGKTTFNNYINILFGDNFVLINPEDLLSSFNSSYATKNIICIDETVIDKAHSIEKLKSIATAKTMNVNQKHVSNYAVPFFGKVIISTNKEIDFIKIDPEEIRFWIRKIGTVHNINTNIERDLIREIPAFLRYLLQMSDIDTSKSRMVLTADEIKNQWLQTVKDESLSSLHKELNILFSEHFNSIKDDECYCSAGDIKLKWFHNNNNVSASYITKVLKYELKVESELIRYNSFNATDPTTKKIGRAFCLKREMFDAQQTDKDSNDIPF